MGSPLLLTDGYKFSMAEAGWPLRRETFYYSHRKGGLHLLPFDVEAEVRAVLPDERPDDFAWLTAHDYELGSGTRTALRSKDVVVRALPKFSVFADREPVFSVTGASALMSWLEPLALTWSYRIQVATLALTRPDDLLAAVGVVTCERQAELVRQTLDAVKVKAPSLRVDSGAYVERVRTRTAELVSIVGNPDRIFEVGLRAATCPEQHLLALEGVKAAGVKRTSNVEGARQLGMIPVGTMGHEHIQRYGSDDAAFRAMVERRYQRSSFLLDTFDTERFGIPAAYTLIEERKGQGDSVRFDSGEKESQYRFAIAEAKRRGIRPVMILEDGFDAAQTRQFETLRQEVGWGENEQSYGYGGYLVAQTSGSSLTRDRVSAVYKLSQTGHRAAMKFGNEANAGKQSFPGRPVLFRRRAGAGGGPFGVVGQEGEAVPEGYELLTGSPELKLNSTLPNETPSIAPSPATAQLVAELSAWRAA